MPGPTRFDWYLSQASSKCAAGGPSSSSLHNGTRRPATPPGLPSDHCHRGPRTNRRTHSSAARAPPLTTSYADGRADVIREGPARGGGRGLGLPAARRRLGLVERRPRDGWRHVPARRHALRPAPDRRDARRDAPDHAGRRAHRHGRQHACQRRPLLRQRAGGRIGDPLDRPLRRGDGPAAPVHHGRHDARRAVPRSGRRVPGAHLRPVRLRRRAAHAAVANLRGPARSARRRPAGVTGGGGPGPHGRRRHRAPARPTASSSPGTSSSTVATPSSGPVRWPTGSGPATASSPWSRPWSCPGTAPWRHPVPWRT